MVIIYCNQKMAKLCNDKRKMVQKLGPLQSKRLQQRLFELSAASVLEEMRTLPVARCHELKQNRAGQIAVDLVHPTRLVFEPADDPLPRKKDGGLDWTQITAIRILEIVDYHE